MIAKETGFRDRRHMREAFMRGFGVPPQEVRREPHRGGARRLARRCLLTFARNAITIHSTRSSQFKRPNSTRTNL